MRKPRLLKLPKHKIATDTQFIETLVWVLEQARKGEVLGYAMTFIVKDKENGIRTIEAAKQQNDGDKLQLLGAMRLMETSYIAREYSESNT